MIRTVLINLLFVIFFIGCSDYEEPITNTSISLEKKIKIDTTEYAITGFNHGIFLGLLSDSTFYHRNELWSCFGGGNVKHISGTYKKDNNKITLLPIQVKTTSYEDYPIMEDEIETDDSPKINTYPYQEEKTKIKTDYYIVNINDKSYALSEEKKDNYLFKESSYNDFEILAASLQNRKLRQPFFGGILSRQTTDTTLFTIEQIPAKWRFLFK